MKNILVLYATIEGQTEKIAHTIKGHMEASGARVTLANVKDARSIVALDLKTFDLLVVGASIHIGKIEKEMAVFLNDHAAVIENTPRSLFIVLMAAATKDEQRREQSLAEVRRNLARQLKVDFPDTEMIAGALKYSQYNWLVKWVMKRIAGKEGGSTNTARDHEYTDWDQVEDYAHRLARS